MDKGQQQLASLISGVRSDIQGFGDTMLEILRNLDEKVNKLMASIDDVISKVQNETSVIDSVLVLIQGLRDQVAAAGVDPAKLQAALDAIDANTAKLSAAVPANTPAAPTEAPPATDTASTSEAQPQ